MKTKNNNSYYHFTWVNFSFW